MNYGLFLKIGKRWVRIGDKEFPLNAARRYFEEEFFRFISWQASLRPTNSALQVGGITIPAYGRDYSSEEELQKGWNQGKDFFFLYPHSVRSYINKEDFERYRNDFPGGKLLILYNGERNALIVD